jgi:hypothetical protein
MQHGRKQGAREGKKTREAARGTHCPRCTQLNLTASLLVPVAYMAGYCAARASGVSAGAKRDMRE